MKCCFWCLEKCIKFLNRNAYIMVSSCNWTQRPDRPSQPLKRFTIVFLNFFPLDCNLRKKLLHRSSRCLFPSHEKHYSVRFHSYSYIIHYLLFLACFNSTLSHILHRVAVLDKVTDFLLFLGKLLIVGIVGKRGFFYFIFRSTRREKSLPF